jgi:hypothetical protein
VMVQIVRNLGCDGADSEESWFQSPVVRGAARRQCRAAAAAEGSPNSGSEMCGGLDGNAAAVLGPMGCGKTAAVYACAQVGTHSALHTLHIRVLQG